MFHDITDCDIVSYADDNTSYCSSFSVGKVFNKLQACTNNLFKWFHENHMKAYADKCHLLVTTNSAVFVNMEDFVISNSNEEKLLGIKIDTKFSFENQIQIQKAGNDGILLPIWLNLKLFYCSVFFETVDCVFCLKEIL